MRAYSPVLGLGWALWRRHHMGLCILAACWVGVTALVQALPDPEARRLAPLATLLLGGFLYLAAVFAFPEADIAGRGSGFPARMLTLPVPTRDLVLWPMLFGCGAMAGAWVAFAGLILPQLGAEAPLWWPALMLGAMLACLQGVLWTPLGAAYARIPLLIALLPGMVSGGTIAGTSGVPEGAIAGAFAGILVAAFCAAVAGVSRARRGDVPEWFRVQGSGTQGAPGVQSERQTPNGLGLGSRTEGRTPGTLWVAERRGPLAAQRWLEWREHGRILPLVVGVFCLLVSLPFLCVRDLVPLEPNAPRSALGSVEVNLWLRLLLPDLLAVPLLAAVVGWGRKRFNLQGKDLSLGTFTATRPLPAVSLIGAKLAGAGGSTLAAWAVMLGFFLGWLLLPARDGEQVAPLLVILPRYAGPAALPVIGGTLLFLAAWTWKAQVQGLWADLSGRAWIVYGAPWAAHGLVLAAFVFVAQGGPDPGVDPQYAPVPAWLPLVVGIGLALKAGAAGWALREARRSEIMTTAGLAAFCAVWLAALLALFVFLNWLLHLELGSGTVEALFAGNCLPIPRGASPLPEGVRSAGWAAAAAVLFLPLARLLGAPLALHRNRHH